MKGIILGLIIAIISIILNIIFNGIYTSYVYYSNYLFLSGILMGLIGGFLYMSRWFNDRRIIKKIIKNEELPEKRFEFEYMTNWGNIILTASFILIGMSLIIVLIYE
ncbi:hypothetical protein ACETAC_02885 [Aceticella autotrophica]|jgi:hypothetical protein|uniref:DUF3899 domain-containing protein n=1 Tax=Aceticella autotrophica TaxID=2755338 RepID=A0A975GAU8_9THEO|nr:hypothetical protein [Aceticella autotrophica]MDI6603884.1 hypothetical protein [Thermoanaerobacteraceae bacterium]QSZ27849.1 hypothetical protein ACETAC_02885 [Aceticella autotrophica]